MNIYKIFITHFLRYASRHRALTLLNILGIALGVAVFSGIRMIHDSALASFRASIDLVAGKAHLQVLSDGVGMDETVFPKLRSLPGVAGATPVIESIAILDRHPGEYLHLIGIDLFTNQPFRTFDISEGASTLDAASFVSEINAVGLTEELMRRLKLEPGQSVRVRHRGNVHELKIMAVIRPNEVSAGIDEHTAVMDIAHAQHLFGNEGRIDRVDLRLDEGVSLGDVTALAKPIIPANARVESADRRGDQIEKMIGAFQLNLTALALISLLVGMFIIYNTVSAGVVRRRYEIGLLRALGFTPNQVQGLFLSEAIVLGLMGAALGLAGGFGLAKSLLSTVSQNITTLYILVAMDQVTLEKSTFLWGLLGAMGAVIVAAWIPSRAAGQLSPVEAMHPGSPRHADSVVIRRGGKIGLCALIFAISAAWGALRGGVPTLSFGCALGVLLCMAFWIPSVAKYCVRHIPCKRVESSLAQRNFLEALHRNAVTMAALAIALAMVVALSVMIQSFRTTVSVWMDRSIRADLFVSSAANLIVGHKETLPPEIEAHVLALKEVAAVDSYREIKIQYQDRPVKLAGIRFDVASQWNPLDFVRGDGKEILALAAKEGQVVISESFSRKFKKQSGDSLVLATPRGEKTFKIAGVIYDYTTEFGLILMDRATYATHWQDKEINSLAIYAVPGVSAEQIRDILRPVVAPLGEYLLYSNRDLRDQVFRIFDQTFAVTYLLQTIGLIVSAVSIWLGQQILLAERRNELGLLRAAGATRKQVLEILLRETAWVAGIGSVAGIMGGLGLALVLSEVINIAFFGWSLRWDVPWGMLGLLIPGVIAVALISAFGPAWRILQKQIAVLVFRV